jgi:transposase
MESDAEKRFDYALLSDLRELRFLREERLRVIRPEHDCLKRLNREAIQKNLESIPGIGFDTAVVLQAELWDMKRFKGKDQLNSYVGLAPHLVGSGEHEEVKSSGNRKKKQLHYRLIESAWRAVRFNREYSARYGAMIGKGTCPQKAISIIAKKLLLSIRAVWLQNREYQVLLPKTK